MHDLQTVGLVYDLVGILVLGVPLCAVGTKTIVNRSATYWNANKPEAERMLGERMDVLVGTLVLAAGFVLQIVAAQQVVSPPWVGGGFLGALAVG